MWVTLSDLFPSGEMISNKTSIAYKIRSNPFESTEPPTCQGSPYLRGLCLADWCGGRSPRSGPGCRSQHYPRTKERINVEMSNSRTGCVFLSAQRPHIQRPFTAKRLLNSPGIPFSRGPAVRALSPAPTTTRQSGKGSLKS